LSKKFKKYSLKVEFLNMELEDRNELFKEYNINFNQDFKKEIEFLNSLKKEEKNENTIKTGPKPKPSKLSQKIYRNLAKILHPDVSKLNNAESIFKTVTDYYENDNLIGLISVYNEYKMDIMDISDSEFELLESKIEEAEKKIKGYESTLSWVWHHSDENKEFVKSVIYEIMGINREQFENWKKSIN
jgi:hypothetical protein